MDENGIAASRELLNEMWALLDATEATRGRRPMPSSWVGDLRDRTAAVRRDGNLRALDAAAEEASRAHDSDLARRHSAVRNLSTGGRVWTTEVQLLSSHLVRSDIERARRDAERSLGRRRRVRLERACFKSQMSQPGPVTCSVAEICTKLNVAASLSKPGSRLPRRQAKKRKRLVTSARTELIGLTFLVRNLATDNVEVFGTSYSVAVGLSCPRRQ